MVKVRCRALSPIGDDGEIRLDALKPRHHVPHLVDTIQRHPDWKKGAEIGVAQGRTLLSVMRETTVDIIAVDAFQYIEDSEKSGLYQDMDHNLNECCVNAIYEKFPDRIQLLKGASLEMSKQVEDGSLDFIFIDASHMYEEVKQDILHWAPKVKPSGWIMGHDYCDRWDGVRRAVDELLGKPLELPSSIWAHEAAAYYEKFG